MLKAITSYGILPSVLIIVFCDQLLVLSNEYKMSKLI